MDINRFLILAVRRKEIFRSRQQFYESKTTGNRTQYLPPVAKIFYEGNNVFLNKRIAESSLDLERRCMTYGDVFSKMSESIHKIILDNLNLFEEGYRLESLGSQRDEKRKLVSCNPNSVNSRILISYSAFLTEDGRSNLEKMLSDPEKGVTFEKTDRGIIHYSTTIYPGGLKVSYTEFINCIMDGLSLKQVQLRTDKKKLMKECDKKNKETSQTSQGTK